jgi:hypothetical protein
VPGRVPLTVSEGDRWIVIWSVGAPSIRLALPVPARPAALDDSFSAWLPLPAEGWALRYRVVRHTPPAAPPPPPRPGRG